MSVFRFLLVGTLLLLPLSEQVFAQQYANPAAYSTAVPRYAYNPYSRAPYPPAVAPNAFNPYYRAPYPQPGGNGYPFQYPPLHGYTQQVYQPARPPAAAPATPNITAQVQAGGKHKTSNSDHSGSGNSPVLNESKQDFIERLLPYIEKENQRLSQLRGEVIRIFTRMDDGAAGQPEAQRLQKLAKHYRLTGDPSTSQPARDELLRKIDIIPSSLALAQAANESAWGESRFAQQANNLFGIWTYDESKGLKPKKRAPGKKHLVRIFDDFGDSVQYYMHTLNSHPAYKPLRDIRRQLRKSRQRIDGHELALGLEKYSAKGQEYIELIQRLIRQHEWATLDTGNQRA